MDVKLGGGKDKSPSIEWISRFAVDQEIFRGVLMNIQAKAGVASLEKQIQIVQEWARPNGWATHFGGPVIHRVAYQGWSNQDGSDSCLLRLDYMGFSEKCVFSAMGEKMITLVFRLWGNTAQSEGMRVMKWNISLFPRQRVRRLFWWVFNYMMFNSKDRSPEMSPEVSEGKHKYSAVLLNTCYFLS